MGERLLVNAHGNLGYAPMNSGSIRQVIELFERYVGLRTSLVSIPHKVRGKDVRFSFAECLRLMLTVAIADSFAPHCPPLHG